MTRFPLERRDLCSCRRPSGKNMMSGVSSLLVLLVLAGISVPLKSFASTKSMQQQETVIAKLERLGAMVDRDETVVAHPVVCLMVEATDTPEKFTDADLR